MQNKKAYFIRAIDKIVADKHLSPSQRKTLAGFDLFNQLEAQCALSTRESYVRTLRDLGLFLKGKPFENYPAREDLQTYIALKKQVHTDNKIAQILAHLKRFYRWLEWKWGNKDKPDEEKLDIKDVKVPYCARWMKPKFKPTDVTFEDLPTEEEVLKMAENVDSQRDRAMLLALWETACSPIELLSLRIKDIVFNQYGAEVVFPRYIDAKTKQKSQLKTEFRYRKVPIRVAVPDLQLWISMHPRKGNLDAALWWSRKGGTLGYQQLSAIFHRARKRSGITKRLNPYSFRHLRLTQVANVLSPHELKRFAGHSRFSNITPTYLHADDKAIQTKVLKERGVEVKPEKPTETPLKIKVCPRCKHENSPTFKFCAMCSMPLDTKTMFEAQRQGDKLMDFVNRLGAAIGVDNETGALVLQQIGTDEEHKKRKRINPDEDLETFLTLIQLVPAIKHQFKRLWESVAAQHLKQQTQTPTAKAQTT